MRKIGEKIVVMVCITAMIMTNLPNWDADADVSGTPWSETGDTLVGNVTVWKDEIITLNGNLTVNETGNLTISNVLLTLNGNLTINETGSLTLDNVTLIMNCTTNGSYYIEVQPGGEMYILNSSNITSADPNAHYMFWVRNGSKFEMRDSELHECGWEWHWDHRGLMIETDNTIIENSTISDNYFGIFLHISNNNRITNNTITTNNYYGIYLDHASNNTIANCTIYNNPYDGIYLYDSSNNNTMTLNLIYNNGLGIHLFDFSDNNVITYNQIYNNSNYGIWLSLSSNNTISACQSYKNSDTGIYLDGSSNNQITNCDVYNNDHHGISLHLSSDNNIIANLIYNNSDDGIWLYDSSNNNIMTSNQIYNNSLGIHLDSSSNSTLANCNIYNNSYGIKLASSYLSNSSNNHIVNSTITNSANYDFYLDQNSQLISLNTTFNKTSVHFADENSTLNVSWYLNVNVLWNNSIPAEYANVRIQDNINGTFDENYTTDKNGWKKNIEIQEYTQNKTNITFFTPHNVTAWQGVFINSTNVTVNRTKDFTIIFVDHNAPEILNISPEQELTIYENTTVEFSFNVSHPDNLTLTYYWYLYLNETEVENVTGILGNTSTTQKVSWSYPFDFMSHGNYTVKVLVSDENATVSVIWVLTVNDVNGAPVIEYYYPPKNIILGNNSCVIFNITASDPDNDTMAYQWIINNRNVSEGLITNVYNQTGYIFPAEYTASEDATNTYLIELVITDNGTPPKSVNQTWTVIVVDLDALCADLLNQTELLENITGLMANITDLLNQLNQSQNENINLTETIRRLNENLTRIWEELNSTKNMLEDANASMDQANETRDNALRDEQDAENATKEMENRINNAIEAKNKAEYKLGASVVCAVIGGIIAGFLVSFLLRRKLPKKGKP